MISFLNNLPEMSNKQGKRKNKSKAYKACKREKRGNTTRSNVVRETQNNPYLYINVTTLCSRSSSSILPLRVVIVDPNRPSQVRTPRRVDDADDDDEGDDATDSGGSSGRRPQTRQVLISNHVASSGWEEAFDRLIFHN